MRAFVGIALVAAAVLLAGMPAAAEDTEALNRRASDEFTREVTTCSAYFLIRMEFLRNGGRNNYILMTELMADKMLQKAEQLLTAEKAQEAIRAEGLRLLKEIRNDLRNMRELNEKYGTTCHAVYTEPDARLAYWVETIRTGAPAESFVSPGGEGRSGRRADSP